MKARKPTFSFHSALVAAAVLGLAAPAFAQDTTPTPAEPAPATHHRSSGGSGAGLGVGATAFLGGPTGPQVVYDFGIWHLEALLGFDRRPVGGPGSPSATLLDFGVGGWYHLNIGDSSDFSLGGALGFSHFTGGAGATAVVIEPGAMIRAFVTSNVAVHGRLGVVMAFDSAGRIDEHLGLEGNLVSGFGATYFWR